jgi:hypothetical protein
VRNLNHLTFVLGQLLNLGVMLASVILIVVAILQMLGLADFYTTEGALSALLVFGYFYIRSRREVF